MGAADKIRYFHYFISKIVLEMKGMSSFEEALSSDYKALVHTCDLSKLKLLKLLFFAVVVDALDTKNPTALLDSVFDNFSAMPYGPVESDIYSKLDSIENYSFTKNSMSLSSKMNIFKYDDLNSDFLSQIDQSIALLMEKNQDILSMSAFDLVELSHKAVSWRIVFAEAKRKGIYSAKMSSEIIKSTATYFQ